MSASFIVITHTHFVGPVGNEDLELLLASLPIFEKQPGLVSIRMHIAEDRSHTMSYMEWRSRADHEACMTSPDFADFQPRWSGLLSSGRATFKIDTYQPLALTTNA